LVLAVLVRLDHMPRFVSFLRDIDLQLDAHTREAFEERTAIHVRAELGHKPFMIRTIWTDTCGTIHVIVEGSNHLVPTRDEVRRFVAAATDVEGAHVDNLEELESLPQTLRGAMNRAAH